MWANGFTDLAPITLSSRNPTTIPQSMNLLGFGDIVISHPSFELPGC